MNHKLESFSIKRAGQKINCGTRVCFQDAIPEEGEVTEELAGREWIVSQMGDNKDGIWLKLTACDGSKRGKEIDGVETESPSSFEEKILKGTEAEQFLSFNQAFIWPQTIEEGIGKAEFALKEELEELLGISVSLVQRNVTAEMKHGVLLDLPGLDRVRIVRLLRKNGLGLLSGV
jgi:hypothetical protein